MGTTYFLLLIVTSLSGAFLYLRKVNAKSYLVGTKNDAVDHEALRLQNTRQKKDTEHPRVEAYVDWYMTKLESKRCEKERRKNLGTAFIVNDAVSGGSGHRSHAVH